MFAPDRRLSRRGVRCAALRGVAARRSGAVPVEKAAVPPGEGLLGRRRLGTSRQHRGAGGRASRCLRSRTVCGPRDHVHAANERRTVVSSMQLGSGSPFTGCTRRYGSRHPRPQVLPHAGISRLRHAPAQPTTRGIGLPCVAPSMAAREAGASIERHPAQKLGPMLNSPPFGSASRSRAFVAMEGAVLHRATSPSRPAASFPCRSRATPVRPRGGSDALRSLRSGYSAGSGRIVLTG